MKNLQIIGLAVVYCHDDRGVSARRRQRQDAAVQQRAAGCRAGQTDGRGGRATRRGRPGSEGVPAEGEGGHDRGHHQHQASTRWRPG